MRRALHFKLEPTVPDDGEMVPLEILLRSLEAIQKAVFDAGESLYGERGPRRAGRRPNAVVATCGLEVANIASGSVSADLQTVEPDPQLFEDDTTLGDRAVGVVTDVLNALGAEDPGPALRRAVPSAAFRQRILSDLQAACPRRGEGYIVSLSDGDGRRFMLTPDAKEQIEDLRYEPVEDVRTLIGELVELRVVDPHRFDLRRDEREIRCTYSPDFLDAVLSNAGETVAVRGRVYLDENDRIHRMDEVYDIQLIDLSPQTMQQAVLGNRMLEFARPIRIHPAVSEDVVVIELPALGIVSYGETSDEALESFHEDLFMVWDEYACAPDEDLAEDALDLKHRARQLLSATRGDAGV